MGSSNAAKGNRGVSKPVRYRLSCDGCYDAKVKCSQEKPCCKRCEAHEQECVYGISRRNGRHATKSSDFREGSVSEDATAGELSDSLTTASSKTKSQKPSTAPSPSQADAATTTPSSWKEDQLCDLPEFILSRSRQRASIDIGSGTTASTDSMSIGFSPVSQRTTLGYHSSADALAGDLHGSAIYPELFETPLLPTSFDYNDPLITGGYHELNMNTLDHAEPHVDLGRHTSHQLLHGHSAMPAANHGFSTATSPSVSCGICVGAINQGLMALSPLGDGQCPAYDAVLVETKKAINLCQDVLNHDCQLSGDLDILLLTALFFKMVALLGRASQNLEAEIHMKEADQTIRKPGRQGDDGRKPKARQSSTSREENERASGGAKKAGKRPASAVFQFGEYKLEETDFDSVKLEFARIELRKIAVLVTRLFGNANPASWSPSWCSEHQVNVVHALRCLLTHRIEATWTILNQGSVPASI